MRWIWLILLLPGISQAGTVVICDPSDPKVPNRVSRVHFSAPESKWLGRPNVLVNPTITVTDPPFRYWKCSGGAVINMTTQEKTDLDAERNRRNQEITDDVAELLTSRTKLRQDFIDWDTMTAQQRQAATKNILRMLLLRDRIEGGGLIP